MTPSLPLFPRDETESPLVAACRAGFTGHFDERHALSRKLPSASVLSNELCCKQETMALCEEFGTTFAVESPATPTTGTHHLVILFPAFLGSYSC